MGKGSQGGSSISPERCHNGLGSTRLTFTGSGSKGKPQSRLLGLGISHSSIFLPLIDKRRIPPLIDKRSLGSPSLCILFSLH